MLANWENSPEKIDCTNELNYLVECYIWTSKSDTIGKNATGKYQTKYLRIGEKNTSESRNEALGLRIVHI